MNEQIDDIIKGCIAGKRDSQRKLYELFRRKMFGICLRYSKDYTEAEDIVQDGFIKVFEKISQFEFKGSFEGWIRRIMVNTALERFRKIVHLFPVTDITEYDRSVSYEHVIDLISSKDLLKLIQELPAQYKLVFNMYAIEGYSHKEIGEMLGISEGTSKSNLSRGRQILQKKINEEYYFEQKKINKTYVEGKEQY